MNILFVVSHRHDWPFNIAGVEVVTARAYLTDPAYSSQPAVKVFNLCSSYRYQTRGYYVSLLAEARGHQPLPDVKAIEDMQSENLIDLLADNLNGLVQSSFSNIDTDHIEINSYFGRDASSCHDQVGEQLFNVLHTPLLRSGFERSEGKWHLRSVRMLGIADIAAKDYPMVARAAAECLEGHKLREREPAAQRPSIAILRSPSGVALASNPAATQKFLDAAALLGMHAEVITRDDAERLPQFDALFIRDNTAPNHYTYQYARQAKAAGQVVIDDPDSILKCNNKVYVSELLSRHHIPTPKTLVVHRDNIEQVIPQLGLPCVLKKPDGAFSIGVVKVDSEAGLQTQVEKLLKNSELILAQEYLPTEFDWRVGILDGRPLFACKYHMAPGHWQIIKHEERGITEGKAEAVALGEAPDDVIDIAVQAANLIGDGFYGVDLKKIGPQCYVIEINDNPNVDAGNEDGVLKDALYREVMAVFRKRIETRKGAVSL